MKALFIIVSLLASSWALAAQDAIVLECRNEISSGSQKRIQDVTVTQGSDQSLKMSVFQCTGFINWGCRDADLNQTYPVTTSDGVNFSAPWDAATLKKVEVNHRLLYLVNIGSQTVFEFDQSQCH